MVLKPSTKSFIRDSRKTHGFSIYDMLHGYIYARFIYTYVGIAIGEHPSSKAINIVSNIIAKIASGLRYILGIKPPPESSISLADTYHGKVLPLDSIKKLVSVQQDIHLENLEKVIPFKLAKDIILEHPDHIAVLDCPCRANRENPCLPMDVCMVIGEPFTSMILEHHPKRSRKITQNEAIQILEDEDERGHVHHAFFKDAMLGRYYAICNCCSCCCGAIEAHENGTPMLASSGYIAVVDQDACIGCGICNSYCQFHALTLNQGVNTVDTILCMGCGICVSKCSEQAITLRLEPSRGIPLEIINLLEDAAIIAKT